VTGKRVDYDFSSFPAPEVDLKGYALWNFYAQYGLLKNKLNIFADIKNITNKKDYYEVYGYNVQGINVTGGIRFQL